MSPVNEQTSNFDGFEKSLLDSRRANELDSFNDTGPGTEPGEGTPIHHLVFSQARGTVYLYYPDDRGGGLAGTGKVACSPYGVVHQIGDSFSDDAAYANWNRDVSLFNEAFDAHVQAQNNGSYEAAGRVTPYYSLRCLALRGSFWWPSAWGCPFYGSLQTNSQGIGFGIYDYSGDPYAISLGGPLRVDIDNEGHALPGMVFPQRVAYLPRPIHDIGEFRTDPITHKTVPAYGLTAEEYVVLDTSASGQPETWQYNFLEPASRNWRPLVQQYTRDINDPVGEILFTGQTWAQSHAILEELPYDVNVSSGSVSSAGWLANLANQIQSRLP